MKGKKPKDLIERFLEHIEISDSCWSWKGRKDKNGYGQFYMKLDGKEITVRPHRFSYMFHKGKIANDLEKLFLILPGYRRQFASLANTPCTRSIG